MRGDNCYSHQSNRQTSATHPDKEITIFRPYSDPIIRKGKDYALLLAVDDYEHWTQLQKPVSDAETIQHDLETLYGFQTTVNQEPNAGSVS